MATPPVIIGNALGPTLPLAPNILLAYQALYDQYENAIQSTADPVLLRSLNDSRDAVASVIALNDDYIVKKNTQQYELLLTQIKTANHSLGKLQDAIHKTAGHIQLFADILGGITKVLTLVPAI